MAQEKMKIQDFKESNGRELKWREGWWSCWAQRKTHLTTLKFKTSAWQKTPYTKLKDTPLRKETLQLIWGRRLIFQMYEECLPINKKKLNGPIFKNELKDMRGYLAEEEVTVLLNMKNLFSRMHLMQCKCKSKQKLAGFFPPYLLLFLWCSGSNPGPHVY